MSFHGLIEYIRLDRLRWRKQDGWLPSARSEELHHVPYAWVASELCALVAAYPGGITMAIAVTELQRKWNENHHVWGRNLAGVQGSVALVQQSRSVPFEAVLELQLVSQEANSWTMKDWRGHLIECLLCEKMGRLALSPGESLLRMTGLRVISSAARARVRLLPTHAFTVLVREEADLVARKEGNVLARIKSVERPKLIKESLQTPLVSSKRQSIHLEREFFQVQVELVVQTAAPQPGRLLLSDDYLLIASLLKPRDLIVIQDAEIILAKRGAVPVYRIGPESCIFQCPADPASSIPPSDGGSIGTSDPSFSAPAADSVDNRLRLGRISICNLPDNSMNSTILVQVVRVKAARVQKNLGRSLVLEVRDIGTGDHGTAKSSPAQVYCWERCCEAAACLWEGQLALLKNVTTKKGILHLSGPEAAVVAVPFRGWLGSPSLHVFSAQAPEVHIVRGALLVQPCVVKQVLVHVACLKEVAQEDACPHCGTALGNGSDGSTLAMVPTITEAVFDDGLQRYCIKAATAHASAALAYAQTGSLWDICVAPSRSVVLECIPSHSVQRAISLFKG